MSVKRVVVLGHTGFLGGALLRHYRDREIPAVGYARDALDLRHPEAAEGLAAEVDDTTAVVVAAAITRDRGDSLDAFADNLAMATSVARAIERRRAGRWLYVSTDGIYAADANPVRETSPLDPVGYYPLAKFAAERLVERAAGIAGRPLLIVRPTALYGGGDTHGSYGPNQFLRSALADGTVRLFGSGEEHRDHLYIDDAVALLSRLIDVEATGVYNLATGESHSFAAVVEAIERVLGRNLTVISLPRRVPVTHRHFDVTRLVLAVPDVRFTPLDDGLAACVKFSARAPS